MKNLPEVQLANLIWMLKLIVSSGKVATPEQIENLARIKNEIARLREIVKGGNETSPS